MRASGQRRHKTHFHSFRREEISFRELKTGRKINRLESCLGSVGERKKHVKNIYTMMERKIGNTCFGDKRREERENYCETKPVRYASQHYMKIDLVCLREFYKRKRKKFSLTIQRKCHVKLIKICDDTQSTS